MFDYDWFHGTAFAQQQEEARYRCAASHYPDVDHETCLDDEEFRTFFESVETRRLIYLRDGFSYEVKQLAEVPTKAHLTFECEPVDDQYRVGSFVVSVPFEEIVRVEVFAVHPSEKPEDSPQIQGFRRRPDQHPGEDPVHSEAQPAMNEAQG
ncbi:MAG: hypothetical protein GXP29_13575 [Planctomycetes bacterium]|nr:hypothetical protein [Planctomycetota bacterium]